MTVQNDGLSVWEWAESKAYSIGYVLTVIALSVLRILSMVFVFPALMIEVASWWVRDQHDSIQYSIQKNYNKSPPRVTEYKE